MSKQHDLPLDVDGAMARVLDRVARDLSEVPEDHPDAADAQTLAARLAWLKTVRAATEELIKIQPQQIRRGSELMFAADLFAEICGAAIGSVHETFCAECFENNIQQILQQFANGMNVSISHNRGRDRSKQHAAAVH